MGNYAIYRQIKGAARADRGSREPPLKSYKDSLSARLYLANQYLR